jgi:pilus assembly protein Flp/PilA
LAQQCLLQLALHTHAVPVSKQREEGKKMKRADGKKMENIKQLLMQLATEESGQDLIEYALVAALVGLGSISAISGLTNAIRNSFNSIGNALTNAI